MNVAIPLWDEFEHYEYGRYETTTCYYLLLEILLPRVREDPLLVVP